MTFIHTIYSPLIREQFETDKNYFANILEDYVEDGQLKVAMMMNCKSIVQYWWRQIFINDENARNKDIDFVIKIVEPILKRIIGGNSSLKF